MGSLSTSARSSSPPAALDRFGRPQRRLAVLGGGGASSSSVFSVDFRPRLDGDPSEATWLREVGIEVGVLAGGMKHMENWRRRDGYLEKIVYL